MKIADLMTKTVHTRRPSDSLEHAARLMWDHDCGALPVVDDAGRAIGMITDRDALMAAYTQGKTLAELPVSIAASREIFALRPSDPLEAAEWIMGIHQIRRVPIVDDAGRPVGIVTLGDVARRAQSHGDSQVARPVGWTLATITRPRGAAPAYRVASFEGEWVVFDRDGICIARGARTQGDAVIHAKELARRDGGAYVVVEGADRRVVSEFFHQPAERAALAGDDAIPTIAATHVAHVARPH